MGFGRFTRLEYHRLRGVVRLPAVCSEEYLEGSGVNDIGFSLDEHPSHCAAPVLFNELTARRMLGHAQYKIGSN
jgi:hypothetical protein